MRWRLANPEQSYTLAPSPAGLAVTAPSGTPGIGALLYTGPNRWNLPAQGAALPGRGPLKVWLGLDPAMDWKRSAYVSIPPRLRRSPLNLVIRDLTGGSLAPDPARMTFRAIDFDPW